MNGSVLLADAGITTYGAFATKLCDLGYNIQGEVNITCTEDGNWSDSVAICKIKGILQNVCNKTQITQGKLSCVSPSRLSSRTQLIDGRCRFT